MKHYNLSGAWNINGTIPATFPGTLDTNGFGEPDPDGIRTRLSRCHNYVGKVSFSKKINITPDSGHRAILYIERAKKLTLTVDGKEVPHLHPQSISTPHVWELTSLLSGNNTIEIISDNSYEGWPAKDIIDSSASTDETQINYNGLLGDIYIAEKPFAFIDRVQILPSKDDLLVKFVINSNRALDAAISFKSSCLAEELKVDIAISEGENIFSFLCKLDPNANRWDEYAGNLQQGILSLLSADHSEIETKNITFGIRDYKSNDAGRLTINDHVFFIRSEANCGLFPETGYEPMTVDEWREVLSTYKSFGVNYMRFHSHIPPEAAFTAADELGIMMQPELSCWNHESAFESDEAFNYYRDELTELLYHYANHPSFVALTLGNELQCDKSMISRMGELLDIARSIDRTRLYAIGSNNWYGQNGVDEYSDFYTSSNYYKHDLRGIFAAGEGENLNGCINGMYPNNTHNFENAMSALREDTRIPVFGFEVGQFEVLPDFAQITDYHGVTRANNIALVKELAAKNNIDDNHWKRMVEATGEMALMAYKKEVELVMLTPSMSGISLLSIQDFTGQGTALVGMLDAHLKRKPYSFSDPARFREFFCEVHPILKLEKYTYENTETLEADVVVANYGKRDLFDKDILAKAGELTVVDHISIDFSNITKNQKVDITVSFAGYSNSYSVWVYLPVDPICPQGVYETPVLDDNASKVLSEGGTVFLTPPATKEALPHSIMCHFTTDFWSKGTFPAQDGAMGQLINTSHPIFKDFPTETYTNYQWWPMAMGRAVEIPREITPIIQEMDSIEELRHFAQLFEVEVGNGRLLVSTLGLKENLQYPECRALLDSIYCYLTSQNLTNSVHKITVDYLKSIL